MDRASRVLLTSLVILAVGGGSTPSQPYQESTLGQTFLEPVLPPPEHANVPQISLERGLELTYSWIREELVRTGRVTG